MFWHKRCKTVPDKNLNELVAESQRLRDQLVKQAGKLELIASQLTEKSTALRETIGDTNHDE